MPTNLAIDDGSAGAVRVSGRRTKRETVNEALAEYVQQRKRRPLRAAVRHGRVSYGPGLQAGAPTHMILLDTSVVPAVLRRRRKGAAEGKAHALRELLGGVAERHPYDKLLSAVHDSFPVVLATEGDHLKAADVANTCARHGLALSTPGLLIAAQALNRRARLFTTDADLRRLSQTVGLRLL
jgi:predicted nucleic acid-binding protein